MLPYSLPFVVDDQRRAELGLICLCDFFTSAFHHYNIVKMYN